MLTILILLNMQIGPIDYSMPSVSAPNLSVVRVKTSRKVEKRIGKLIAEGDCAGAEQYALRKGRIELVGEVRRVCAK
jgi:hypothetical protein